jgi:hypothetical protein
MAEEFTWKGEITFRGTPDEFAKLATTLERAPITVEVRRPPWWPPGPFPGFPPPDWWRRFPSDRLQEIIEDSPQMQLKFIRDFPGGIRDPHLHLGSEVVLLDRARFKSLVSEVAGVLAGDRVDRFEDYIDVMAPVNALADIPAPNR